MIQRNVRQNGGSIIFALILLVVGGYYVLRNTFGFDLGDLDEDAIIPLVAVAFGAWLLFRGLTSPGTALGSHSVGAATGQTRRVSRQVPERTIRSTERTFGRCPYRSTPAA